MYLVTLEDANGCKDENVAGGHNEVRQNFPHLAANGFHGKVENTSTMKLISR